MDCRAGGSELVRPGRTTNHTTSSGALPSASSTPDPTCFVCGGVAFEICLAPGMGWSMGAEHRQFLAPYPVSPVASGVRCVVSAAPELAHDSKDREIRWEWSGDVAHVSTLRVRAELRRLETHYVATALVAPTEAGYSALVTALAAAVVEREGGFALHAAGVILDGRAVLFVGPSGAGKTTASNHCEGARWLARDRAVVYPTPLGWYAAGMPGGDEIGLPRAPMTLAPLGGLLRVRRGSSGIIDPGLVGSVRNLRESVTAGSGRGAVEETDRLAKLTALASTARVGELGFGLGEPLTPRLLEWLGRGDG